MSSDSEHNTEVEHESTSADGHYVVVARRYRPKGFGELVGQQHVAQALKNAIQTNRVGHAYLFTGARGVGKTSTARILAKALNDPSGPTPDPDHESDIAKSIDAGQDVDVLEIDGASNRGIDEIRQLRANVNIRPSRAPYKIYIIDEVHMLTNAAFNALLKTLEEPPEHVKFILCTTDPEKIPITVLSRCQRFDFAPVESESIMGRLQYIVEQEGVEAEAEALHMLARRAAGSMRDSQSLLEQLLSYCGKSITVDDVHMMLGTAKGGSLSEIAELLVQRDSAGALRKLDSAVSEGVDLGQLAEQLLGYFRDMMAATVGCDSELMLYSALDEQLTLTEQGKQYGLETILAILQILDQTVTKMRQTAHIRTLVEISIVRICNLEQLDQIPQLIAHLQAGGTTTGVAAPTAGRTATTLPKSPPAPSPAPATSTPVQKKTIEPDESPSSAPQTRGTGSEINSANLLSVWKQALDDLGDMAADAARNCTGVAISGPNQLVVTFSAEYHKDMCERHKSRLEQKLAEVAGTSIRLELRAEPPKQATQQPNKAPVSRRKQMRDKEQDPFVQEAMELFDGEIVRVDLPRTATKN